MQSIHDHRTALRDLGVSDELLSVEERRALDEDGFVLLEGIIDAAQAASMRHAMEEVFIRDRSLPGHGQDSDFIEDRCPDFDICLTHPRFLAAIAHVLQEDFVSIGVHSRPNLPGTGHQALHVDWPAPVPPRGKFYTCNSIWMLSAFTPENGATRVVPGSHRLPQPIHELVADTFAPHQDEVYLCGPPGTVAVFNGHTWHSARLNRDSAPRANVTSFWRRRDAPHGMRAPPLPWSAMQRLSPAARVLQQDRDVPGTPVDRP